MPRMSILLPSRDRPKGLRRSIGNIRETTAGFDVEIVIILDEPDVVSHELVESLQPGLGVITMPPDYINGHALEKWQAGYEATSSKWVVQATDDITFYPNWLSVAFGMPDSWRSKGIVGLWDEHGNAVAKLVMVTREYTEAVMRGHFGLCWYYHCFADNEWTARAGGVSSIAWHDKVGYNHHHWAFGDGPHDSIAQLVNQHYGTDQLIWFARLEAGFPDDWPTVNHLVAGLPEELARKYGQDWPVYPEGR